MKKNKVSATYLLPAGVIYTVLLIIPIIYAFALSFVKWDGIGTMKFIGFDNYIRLFKDSRISNAAVNTIILATVNVVLVNVLALLLALMLNKTSKRTSVFRVIYFLPYVLSGVAISLIWKGILSYTGVLNSVFNALGLEKLVGYYFSSRWPAMAFISVVEIWHSLGYYMIIYLAALQTVPEELYEACTIDGGTSFQKFRYITLPMIIPGATVSLLMSIISQLRIYDTVKVMTDGGPGYDTETIVYSIVSYGFGKSQMGYASAIAVVLFFAIGIMTILTKRLGRQMEG